MSKKSILFEHASSPVNGIRNILQSPNGVVAETVNVSSPTYYCFVDGEIITITIIGGKESPMSFEIQSSMGDNPVLSSLMDQYKIIKKLIIKWLMEAVQDENGALIIQLINYGSMDIRDWVRQSDILKIDNNKNGWTVAHELAKQGERFAGTSIQRLRANGLQGITVAHLMAINGYRFDNPDILELQMDDGTKVKDLQWNHHGR